MTAGQFEADHAMKSKMEKTRRYRRRGDFLAEETLADPYRRNKSDLLMRPLVDLPRRKGHELHDNIVDICDHF
jgi:hypothetical protein